MITKLFCSHCGKEVEYETEWVGKHLKAICSECKIYIKFLSHTPIEQFIMPFGKYRGKLLIDAIKEDRQYFEWLRENSLSRSIKDKINLAIEKL